jgi:hypothetical protein
MPLDPYQNTTVDNISSDPFEYEYEYRCTEYEYDRCDERPRSPSRRQEARPLKIVPSAASVHRFVRRDFGSVDVASVIVRKSPRRLVVKRDVPRPIFIAGVIEVNHPRARIVRPQDVD